MSDQLSSILNNEYIDNLSLDKDKGLVLLKQQEITRIGDLSKYTQVFPIMLNFYIYFSIFSLISSS